MIGFNYYIVNPKTTDIFTCLAESVLDPEFPRGSERGSAGLSVPHCLSLVPAGLLLLLPASPGTLEIQSGRF